MKNTKRIFSVLLVMLMLLSSAPLGGFIGLKASAVSGGNCGADVKWSLDTETGEFKITGSGEMYDYDFGYYAPWWYNYTDLIKTVTIGNNITSIGDYAFADCDSLQSITIPDSVTSIGGSAFLGCTSLESITVDEDNNYYSSDSYGVLYNKDKTTLIQYPSGNTRTSFDIPDSVTSIGDYAFEYCDSLESIEIGNSVTSIGNFAFRYCDSLQSITIPNSVTDIFYGAFSYCRSLKSITIPDSVTTIWVMAFYNCESLKSIEIGSGVTGIGYSYTFSGCDNLESIIVDNNNDYYSSDSYGVLYNKDKTTLIKYPTGNTRTSFDIPDSVTSIFTWWPGGDYAFSECDSLKSITIPNSVTSIGGGAFDHCNSLKDVYYAGSETDWKRISIGSDNTCLTSATIHYNCAFNGTRGKKFSSNTDGMLSIYVYGRDILSGEVGETPFWNSLSGSLGMITTDFDISPNNGSFKEDKYEIQMSEAEKSSYTISKENYQQYIIPQQVIKEIKNELVGVDASLFVHLNLDKKDGKPYVSTVYGKIDTERYSYKEITRNDLTIEEDKQYSIIISACDVGNGAKYYLYQEGGKKLESSNGVFTQEMYSQFSDEGKIYAYVQGSNGTSPAVELKLKKKLSESDAKMKRLLDSGEISLLGNVTEVVTSGSKFLDKAKIDLSVFKIPIDFTFEDNTLKIAIGLKIWDKTKSTDDKSITGTKWKKNYDYSNFVKDIKKLCSEPEKDLTEKYTRAKAVQKKYDKTISTVKSKSKGWDASILGYAEWEYINGKWVFKEGVASICGSCKFEYSQQGFVWVIPEYSYFSAKIELSGNGRLSKSGPSDLYPMELDLSLSAEPQLKVGGGVGFEDLLSAGFWGEATLPISFNFTRKHLTMDAKGKFGYETKFLFIFGTEKTLLEGEVNLIDKYWNNSKAKAVSKISANKALTDKNVKSEDIAIKIVDRSYAENTSKWLGETGARRIMAAKNAAFSGGINFKSLQKSIFEGATPQIASVGDTMIMTFVQDGKLRDDYNRMRLVYSIYDKTNKTWSEPQPVCDDGMNDVNPVIASDGTNVYVAWQKICKKITSETTTAKDICENTEIYVAKYNKSSDKFENAVRVTDNSCYDYAQSVGISNGEPVVYYASCTDNNMNGTANTNIMKFAGGASAKLLSSKNYIYSIDSNSTGSEYTFIMDKDGDTGDNTDVNAFVCSGSSVSEISFDSAVTGTEYVNIGSGEKLLITDGDNIYENNDDEQTPLFEGVTSVIGGIKSAVAGDETVISWTQSNDDGTTDLYYASNSGGKWSEAVRLTSQDKMISSVSITGCDNKLYGIVTKTTIDTDSEGYKSKGQTDLESFEFNDYADISVKILSANEENFYAGKDSQFDVVLTNNGTVNINSVNFTIKDTLGTNKTENKTVSLNPGESKNITLTYPVPENYAKTNLTVEANTVGQNDVISENNTDSMQIGLPDLYFENTNVIAYEDGYLVEAYLYNASDAVANDVKITLNYNSTETEKLNVYSTKSLATKESNFIQAEIPKEKLEFDEDGIAYVYFTASSAEEDSYSEDNIEKISLEKDAYVFFDGHDFKETRRQEATCSSSGFVEYVCLICNETKTEEIPILEHISDLGTVSKAAACTEPGTKTYKCTVCGEIIKTETIPAAGHKPTTTPEVAATCAKTGLTAGSKCSVCGTVLKAQTTVAKKEHTYENVTTKATLTKNGKIVPTCSVCKATKTAATVYYPKTIKLSATNATYTGKAIKPTVNVTDSNGKAIAASNYTVSYKNNTKVGTATVTVTFKGNYSGTKTLTFKIVPGQVKNLKASKVTTTAVKLAWSKVTGAKYYKIEQSTDGKNWKTVKTTDKTTYTVTKLKTGAKYRFRVTALDSTKKIAGKVSSVLKTGTKTASPKVTLKSTKSKTATASWKKVTGASKYIVYKSTNNKKWTKVGSTTKLSYKLSKLSGGKKIYVKVIAVNAYKQNSAYSKVASVTVKK